MAKKDDDQGDRELRIESHAKAAAANDPEHGKPARQKKPLPFPPSIYRAQDILNELIDDIEEAEAKLDAEPALAAMVVMIKRRIRKAADTLFDEPA